MQGQQRAIGPCVILNFLLHTAPLVLRQLWVSVSYISPSQTIYIHGKLKLCMLHHIFNTSVHIATNIWVLRNNCAIYP